MEKERTNAPPGIGPKLPEPQPEMKRPPSRREGALAGIAGLLLVALATWFIIFAIGSGRTPADTVNRFGGENFHVQEDVVQISLPGGGQRSVYFYISGDAMACALLERKASGYRVLNLSGHLPLTGPGKDGIWMTSMINSDKKEFFVFGLLYDTALTTVEVNGEQGVVVDTGPYRCWYYYGEGLMSINSESVVYR